MSLLDIFRNKNDELRRLQQENEILKAEIIVLKNLLFNLELDELGSIYKK
jgi:hypothetical protein